ncbi:amphi-Trp domain-containing protein [Salinadaptatus halalkaliphilus]|uniref:Amphi-Trp domain-containing protein n=1 Tax=Salinadaptatus halalkaliphilus TaxID=2419781 RepID=A0A4S3TS11_9EURY|nr:amphi-Trp domain-containing protein [Salinadaptatus halalkaliphilus]THE66143.1 amphi-Trp domain-containing protein [Salinadaptatus halalkaliphilus]
MADRTTADETLSREELAEYFDRLSKAFAGGSEEVRIDVGNKTVTLRPPETVDVSIDVIERSTLLRGNREEIDIEIDWKPP